VVGGWFSLYFYFAGCAACFSAVSASAIAFWAFATNSAVSRASSAAVGTPVSRRKARDLKATVEARVKNCDGIK
jgi:hypothetical protein